MEKFVVSVTKENFYENVIEKSTKVPVLLDLWSDTCAPCKQMAPILNKIANEYSGKFVLALVNVNENMEIAQHLQITGVPSFRLIINKKVVEAFEGFTPESQIKKILSKYIVTEEKTQLSTINDKVKTLDFEDNELNDIEVTLLKMIETNESKKDDDLQLALMKVCLLNGKVKNAEKISQNLLIADSNFLIEAKAYWENISKLDSFNFEEIKSYDDKLLYSLFLLVKEKNIDECMNILLELVKENKNYGEQIARKAMVSIFTILGSSPEIEDYRNQLYNLLF